MTKYYKFTYTGHCPYLSESHQILIDTAEIRAIGMTAPGYKKTGYSCEYSEDCPHLDEYGRCPLFISAPDEPH